MIQELGKPETSVSIKAALRVCLFILTVVSIMACERAEVADPTETSCEGLEGEWRLRQVTCGGSAVSPTPQVSLEFGTNQRVSQVNGTSACQAVYPWQSVLNARQATLDLLGDGNLQCRTNGEAVGDCTTSSQSCDSATDFTGIANTYSSCFVKGGEIYFRRTVSALNNPDSLSYCEEGQSEQLIFAATNSSSSGESSSGGIGYRAFLRVSPLAGAQFATTDLGMARTLRLSLENQGPEFASLLRGQGLSAPFSFLGGRFPGTGGTCQETLAPEGRCELVLEFRPQELGTFRQELQISYFDGSENKLLKISVAGSSLRQSGVLQISNGPVFDFGEVLVGGAQSHLFTVRNSGELPITNLGEVSVSGPFQVVGGVYPGLGGTCTDRLNAQQTCLLSLEFRPPQAGSFNGRFEMPYRSGVENKTAGRNLFGRGL